MAQNETNRTNLGFRPLDNSMSTQIKYELEAEHWDRAQKSVASRNQIPSVSGVFGFFGGILAIFLGLLQIIFFILAGCLDQYKRWREVKDDEREHQRYLERLDKLIEASPKIKGYDTPDSEYEKD